LQQERQHGQNNNVANHNPVPQEQAAADETVALEMRTTSQFNYMPTKSHIHSVIKDHFMVIEAHTIGEEHCTQCGWCSRNNPDECF